MLKTIRQASPKTKTPRNAKYLAYIRTNDCAACGRNAPSQAAHVRMGGDGGMGLKPSDYRTVPLCGSCHYRQHQIGERKFWDQQVDPEFLIFNFMCIYYLRNKKPIRAEDAKSMSQALGQVFDNNR